MARKWLFWLFFIFLLAFSGWLLWRFTSPVTVEVTSTVIGLPFDVEVIPPVVEAKPGEMVRVIYRIKNNDLVGLEAYATITVEPARSYEQIEVFLSQCTGLNTFQNSYAEEYEVLFRVAPAGLTGRPHLVLRHTFEAATSRYHQE